MCGIFGVATKEGSEIEASQIKAITNSLFKLSESRGKEAAGIAINNHEAMCIFKAPVSASKMIKSKDYIEMTNKHMNKNPLTVIGHSRLVTNGLQTLNDNNQPVIKDGAVGIHNGIVVNVGNLFNRFSQIKKAYEVDTEIILALIQFFRKRNKSIIEAIRETFKNIEGSASIAILFNNSPYIALATNTGSLYTSINEEKNIFVFASEKYILEKLIKKQDKNLFNVQKITHLEPWHGCLINLNNLEIESFNFNEANPRFIENQSKELTIIDLSPIIKTKENISPETKKDKKETNLLQYNENPNLKRCTKCVLPETFPNIEFDENGICNYCRSYVKQELKDEKEFEETLSKYRSKNGSPDCIVAFSGGRDSSYGLHYIKNVLKMSPIAYTYDWGVVTDLARRNQARICGKLGIEHIIVSADIKRKRENIRKNIRAWLKKPDLGMVPLFMAGDKQYFYYANKVKKQTKVKLSIYCENPLEKTDFKNGFCGIKPNNTKDKSIFVLSLLNKIKLFGYYGKQFLSNPDYFNRSVFDSLGGYFASYFVPHNYLFLYQYIKWDEEKINKTLINEYNWETAIDTKSTWRIGDGTVPFYNYIYYTLAGFTENDTFRSNQTREGVISREKALQLIKEENRLRYESLQWYAQQIGFNLNEALKIINSTAKRYKF